MIQANLFMASSLRRISFIRITYGDYRLAVNQ